MTPAAAWTSTLPLDLEPVSAARARKFVRLHLVGSLPGRLANEVELVVSELVTNALVHAQPPVSLSLRAGDQTLRVEVEDGAAAVPVRVVADTLATRGRGIAIVSVLSRDWGVKPRADGGKS